MPSIFSNASCKTSKAKKFKNKIVVNSWQHIHTYIIDNYNPVSCATYIVCGNFIHDYANDVSE